jgi:hypothetical protein
MYGILLIELHRHCSKVIDLISERIRIVPRLIEKLPNSSRVVNIVSKHHRKSSRVTKYDLGFLGNVVVNLYGRKRGLPKGHGLISEEGVSQTPLYGRSGVGGLGRTFL